MIDCMILGDSIAVSLAKVRKDCASYSVGGYNSWQWNRRFFNVDLTARTVIISLGTNDHRGVDTEKELRTLRKRIDADRVYWILPPCNQNFCKPLINDVVEIIAKERGDYIIATKQLQQDGIHPNSLGNKELALKTR